MFPRFSNTGGKIYFVLITLLKINKVLVIGAGVYLLPVYSV